MSTQVNGLDGLIQRLLRASAQLRAHRLGGIAFALVAFGIALAVRLAVDDRLPPGFPFLTFFPAIVVTAFVAGRQPGVVCATLSVLASWYWFMPPRGSFILSQQSLVAVGFFVFISAVDVIVIDVMTRALERRAVEQRRIEALLDERNTLYRELQHRVANTMQMVGSILAVQQKNLAHNSEAVAAIKAARSRFDLLSQIHRRLHDPELADLPLNEFLPVIVSDYMQAMDRPEITWTVSSSPIRQGSDPTTLLALFIVEVLTNTLKHAWPPGVPGQVSVALVSEASGRARLTITDDGQGLPPGVDAMRSERLGMRILLGLARSLGGKMAVAAPPNGRGTVFSLEFPLQHVG